MNKSYFECKRCFIKFYQKIDITRHLDKKHLCTRVVESYKYNNDEIRELSFNRIYITDVNNPNVNKCNNCGKIFSNIRTLKQHIKVYCKKVNNDRIINKNNESIDINSDTNIRGNENIFINGNNNIINNIQNIQNIQTINNNINININITRPFDDIWDTSMIDNNRKIVLLLNSSKFTQTLEQILENEVNLNVLIDKTTGKGMIYNNHKFTDMSVKDIVKRTMNKLYKQLCEFHNDISNDMLDLDKSILNNEIKSVEQKYNDFISNIKIENMVNEYISDIYAKKNNKTYIEYNSKTNIKEPDNTEYSIIDNKDGY